jgi:glycosyltransferase involved in cell wall biosynthesis
MPPPHLRIALALESSGPGGAEQMVLRLAGELRARGHEPLIVTLRPGWMTERAAAAGLRFELLPQRAGLDPLWIPRFAAWLRRERIDVLHSHEFAMNVYGGLAALVARVPSVATIHGRHWVSDRLRRRLAYRALAATGMPIVAVAEDLAQFLRDAGFPADRIRVVPNGIPVPASPTWPGTAQERSAARRALGVPEHCRLLVAVGNLYPVKDHATLLRAAAGLDGVHVAIAGRGEEEKRLRSLAEQLGLDDRLHLLGLRDDVDRVLAAADLFVHPSRSEGLPLAILEAMAAGVPIVATRVGGVPRALDEGRCGVLVAPEDANALAHALRSLLQAPSRAAELGRAAHERALATGSLSTMADRYLELYTLRSGASR